ncbi:conserved hypothetical protein [Neospora caninum Liverpool]|uniref:Transmembrane protein n=1 Tax=Neospora caninum (strain Liverpool) TaxID=572307 RepID=F0VHG6_NEOCL|nr:conserved hypothetical protein [Neospora caninum Liverpool]CBZ53160.1 conserved hypothetical protein [Neospora caninum Liverpool]|eukprot:XP_003883192.1 conserved hypothetical protein [Neospora caninum Liverpool]
MKSAESGQAEAAATALVPTFARESAGRNEEAGERSSVEKEGGSLPSAPPDLPAQLSARQASHPPGVCTPRERRGDTDDTDAARGARLRFSSSGIFGAFREQGKSQKRPIRRRVWPRPRKAQATRRAASSAHANDQTSGKKEPSPAPYPASALSSPADLGTSGSSSLSHSVSERSKPVRVGEVSLTPRQRLTGRSHVTAEETPFSGLNAALSGHSPDWAPAPQERTASAVHTLHVPMPSSRHANRVSSPSTHLRSPLSRMSSTPSATSASPASRRGSRRRSPSNSSPPPSVSPSQFLDFLFVSASPVTPHESARRAAHHDSALRPDSQAFAEERQGRALRGQPGSAVRHAQGQGASVSPAHADRDVAWAWLPPASSGEHPAAWLARRHGSSIRHGSLGAPRVGETGRPSLLPVACSSLPRSRSGGYPLRRRTSARSSFSAPYTLPDSLQHAALWGRAGRPFDERTEGVALGRRGTEGGRRRSACPSERGSLKRGSAVADPERRDLGTLGETSRGDRDASFSVPYGLRRQSSARASTLERVRQACGEALKEDLARLLAQGSHADEPVGTLDACWQRVLSCGGSTLCGASVGQTRTGARLREIAESIACGGIEEATWKQALRNGDEDSKATLGDSDSKRAIRQREEKYRGFLCFVVTVGVLLCAVAAGTIAGVIMASSTLSPSGALLRVTFSLPAAPEEREEAFRDDARPRRAWEGETGGKGETGPREAEPSRYSPVDDSILSLNSLVLLVPPSGAEKAGVAGVLTGGFVVTLVVHNQGEGQGERQQDQGIKANFSALLELSYLPANAIGQAASSVCFTPQDPSVPSRPASSEAALRRLSLSAAFSAFVALNRASPDAVDAGSAVASQCRVIWESFASSSFLLPLTISEGSREIQPGGPALRQVVLDAGFSRSLKTLLTRADAEGVDAPPTDAPGASAAPGAVQPPSPLPSSPLPFSPAFSPSSSLFSSLSSSPSSSARPSFSFRQGEGNRARHGVPASPRSDYALAVTPWLDWTGLERGYNEVVLAVNLNRQIGVAEASFFDALQRDCADLGRVYLAVSMKGVIRRTALQTGDPENWWTVAFRLPCTRVEGNRPAPAATPADGAGGAGSAGSGVSSSLLAEAQARNSTERLPDAGASVAKMKNARTSQAQGSVPPRNGEQTDRVDSEREERRQKAASKETGGTGERSAARVTGGRGEEGGRRAGASQEARERAEASSAWPPSLFVYGAVLGENRKRYKAVLGDVLLRWMKRFPTCTHVIQSLAAESGVELALPTVIH